MSNLYQDAILDAKALRASAMANAKAALEEAFEPKIQEMISKHLSEEAVEENLEEDWNEDGVEEGDKMHGEKPMDETTDINEAELEEILNQLEEMSAPKEESLNEAEKDDEEPEEETEDDDEEGGEEGEPVEEVTDETKVIEITVGDLKQILQSVMPGKEMPDAEPEGAEAGDEMAASLEEVSLEEILDELENEGMETAQGGAGDVADVNTPGKQLQEGGMDVLQGVIEFIQNTPGATVDLVANKINQMFPSVGLDAAINLAKTLLTFVGGGAAVGAARKAFPGVKKTMDTTSAVGPAPKGLTNFEAKDAELNEAKATIATLRKDLQEVNLLNAKYLYMNKLFKSKSLTEAQKLKVINALDKATTVKEVKTAYELMNESFSIQKGQLKESVGFASKPAGVAPKANIVESEAFVSRWQKLAGIK